MYTCVRVYIELSFRTYRFTDKRKKKQNKCKTLYTVKRDVYLYEKYYSRTRKIQGTQLYAHIYR